MTPEPDWSNIRLSSDISADISEEVRLHGINTYLQKHGIPGLRTLPAPWLTLSPAQPYVPGKGELAYLWAKEVGTGNVASHPPYVAHFHYAFQLEGNGKDNPTYPNLEINLIAPPSPLMLAEVDVAAWNTAPGDPMLQVQSNNSTMAMPVEEGKTRTMTFLIGQHARISSIPVSTPGKNANHFKGFWTFFEARFSIVG